LPDFIDMDLKTLLQEVEKAVEKFNLTAGPNTVQKKKFEAKPKVA